MSLYWCDMFLPRQSSIHGEVKHHIIYPGILGTMVRNRPSFESIDESIEPDYKEHRKEYLRQRIVIACFVSLLLSLIGCALITNRGMEIGIWGLWGVNVIGASFCGILLSREILGSDKYVNKICSLFWNPVIATGHWIPKHLISWGSVGVSSA